MYLINKTCRMSIQIFSVWTFVSCRTDFSYSRFFEPFSWSHKGPKKNYVSTAFISSFKLDSAYSFIIVFHDWYYQPLAICFSNIPIAKPWKTLTSTCFTFLSYIFIRKKTKSCLFHDILGITHLVCSQNVPKS